ncbi:hypothetical protein DDM35_001367 [Escherichia coli]|nr:hypothetical protein [Escherichia coli]
MTNEKQPDALRLSDLHFLCNILNLRGLHAASGMNNARFVSNLKPECSSGFPLTQRL